MVGVISKIGETLICKFQRMFERENNEIEHRQNILEDIEQIQSEINSTRRHFDFETDFELIDADIYRLNELELRYNYLIKQAKTYCK